MINVPEKVKDALRDGNLRKHYRFIVQTVSKVYDDELLVDIPTGDPYTILEDPNNYIIKNDTANDIRLYMTYGSASVKLIPAGSEYYYYQDLNMPTNFPEGMELSANNAGLKLYSRDSYHEETTTDYTIGNDNLVKESVKIDERMCSSDKLEFGLCEGSSLEFQYFDFPNIRGKQIEAHLDVEYADGWYDIPMGFYDVEQCSTQFSTGIIKVVAVNKLKSDYLDADAKDLVKDLQSDSADMDKITVMTIQDALMKDYSITPKKTTEIPKRHPYFSTLGSNAPTFKVNGFSTTYYPAISVQHIIIYPGGGRVEIDFDKYIQKVQESYLGIKAAIFEKVQNANTFWEKLIKTSLWQSHFGVSVAYNTVGNYDGAYPYNGENISSWATGILTHGALRKIQAIEGAQEIRFFFPDGFDGTTSPYAEGTYHPIWSTSTDLDNDDINCYLVDTDSINEIEISKSDLGDVTLRELMSANYEMHCQFGKLDRETNLFSGVDLNSSRLFPADGLYPADDLYPDGSAEGSFKSQYSKLWTDEIGEQTFRTLYMTFKTLDSNNRETELTYSYTVNSDGTTDYYMDDNWLLKNLVWTPAQIDTLASSLIDKLKKVKWFPFEMWASGLPYLETGDELEITTKSGTYTSYILQRQLQGIHNLQDTYINGQLDIF